jgi:diguanylate cyclase (GGDEF)-like protein
MANLIKVLLVEHSEPHTDVIIQELRRGGYTVECERVTTPMRMSDALVEKSWDIVLSDYYMSNFNGHDALKVFKRSGLDCPFIIVSETTLDDSGVAVVAAGADDYLTKETLERLVPVVRRELRQAEVRRQLNKANDKLEYITYHDVTTDLPNHLVLHEKIVYAIANATRKKNRVALVSMKINRFRLMNETLGDQMFDLLLIQLARRIRGALDQSATFACLRSNEFAVLIPVTSSSEHVVQIVHGIIKALEPPFILGGGLKAGIQASFGIAFCPEHATAPDLLLKRARAALGTAITNRREYSFYSGEQYETRQNQLSLVTDLRRAIIQNELFLVYQLKVNLPTFQVAGVEALVRWKHPSLGILSPEHFIALAEQTGLIMPLTLWVLNEALRQCRAWKQESRQLTVAVNLSPWNLQSSALPEQIRGLLASSGVSAPQLELEITESALMTNPAQATQTLTAIKEIGLQLSVDDFGTGYSSLAHLHQLPIDAIKIDKSFVRKLTTESRDAVIVRSIIQLAHNLGLKVVADGVENRETLRTLVTMGCDMAQGYYINHPRPAEELLCAFGDQLINTA